MAKVKSAKRNTFCPQSLFLYGTKDENGDPHFGLFCWFSYITTEGTSGPELGVMACIGEEKLTKDLIRKNGVFSANLVSGKLLPLADYYGNTSGRGVKDKMRLLPTVEQGQVLDVPTVAESPVSYELKVQREIHLTAGSDVFLCQICNVTVEESLCNQEIPFMDRLLQADPVVTSGQCTYNTLTGRFLGRWGEPMKQMELPDQGML